MHTLIPALAAALATAGAFPATPAQADSRIAVHYGYGDREVPRWRDRDRDGIPNRDDRYDNRRGLGYDHAPRYGHPHASRCWTEWRYDRWEDRRVQVRVCR